MTVVFDSGSSLFKAGFSGEKAPRTVFRSYVGRQKYMSLPIDIDSKNYGDQYIGDEATINSPFLITKYPIEHGVVQNWYDEEKILKYAYKKLNIDSSDYPVLLTEPLGNPSENSEKMIQVMFESFNVPAFYLSNQCYLSLYSSEKKTCVICEVGDAVTQIMPIYNNKYVKGSAARLNIGGRDVSEYLQILLSEHGYYFTTSEEFELIQNLKEKLGYVALDYDAEIHKANTTYDIDAKFSLPDGSPITVISQRFRCAELLFKPNLNGIACKGIHEKIIESIEKCDISLRKDLLANIILSGGTTMFNGFPERIEKEVTNLAPRSFDVKVIANPDRNFGVWIGGSILGSISQFKDMVVTRKEYNDEGCGIVHRKCG